MKQIDAETSDEGVIEYIVSTLCTFHLMFTVYNVLDKLYTVESLYNTLCERLFFKKIVRYIGTFLEKFSQNLKECFFALTFHKTPLNKTNTTIRRYFSPFMSSLVAETLQ